jgi:sulfatase maturation enzyme AslB (radical SAM superfamily)
MSAYGSHIEQIVATLQEKNSGMCAGCPELKSIEPQSAMEILFHTVSINKHYFCNCKCVYCKVVKEKTPDPYPIFPAIRGLHEQEMLHSRCSFHWGGGEPSILKEFEETSTWISGRGYPQYVHTSALRYSHAIALLLANNGGGG